MGWQTTHDLQLLPCFCSGYGSGLFVLDFASQKSRYAHLAEHAREHAVEEVWVLEQQVHPLGHQPLALEGGAHGVQRAAAAAAAAGILALACSSAPQGAQDVAARIGFFP